MLYALMILAALCALTNIIVDRKGLKTLKYISKPTTMLLIIASLFAAPAHDQTFRIVVLLALLCSLAGDVFLMLEKDYFIAGLGSFLIAHILFIAIFHQGLAFAPKQLLYLLPFLAVAAIMLHFLWPNLKSSLRLPVLIYVAALIAMAWCGTRRFEQNLFDSTSALFVLAGSILFLISDGILSIRRFITEKPWMQAAVLSTYFAAQQCFVLSAIQIS